MYKVTPRRWQCPICKVRCYEVIIDAYQLQIAQLIRKHNLSITEISFDERGRIDNIELAHLMESEESLKSLPPHAIKNNNQFFYLQELRESTSINQTTLNPTEEMIIKKVTGMITLYVLMIDILSIF